jgi:hypothetical protein
MYNPWRKFENAKGRTQGMSMIAHYTEMRLMILYYGNIQDSFDLDLTSAVPRGKWTVTIIPRGL